MTADNNYPSLMQPTIHWTKHDFNSLTGIWLTASSPVALDHWGIFELIGSLRNDDGDGNKNGKKVTDLDKQNNNFARASRFFVHFSAVVARLQRETA